MPTQKNTHINKHPAKASTALPLPPLPTHSLDNLSPTPHTYLQPSRKVKGKAGHVSDKHPRSRHSAPNGLEPPHPIPGYRHIPKNASAWLTRSSREFSATHHPQQQAEVTHPASPLHQSQPHPNRPPTRSHPQPATRPAPTSQRTQTMRNCQVTMAGTPCSVPW